MNQVAYGQVIPQKALDYLKQQSTRHSLWSPFLKSLQQLHGMISYLFLSQFSDAFMCLFQDPGPFPLVVMSTLKFDDFSSWQTGILALLTQMQCLSIPPISLLSTAPCWTLLKCKVLMISFLPWKILLSGSWACGWKGWHMFGGQLVTSEGSLKLVENK